MPYCTWTRDTGYIWTRDTWRRAHLRPDLDDAAVVGDELLRRHAEGGVADDRLDAPADTHQSVSWAQHILVMLCHV